MKPKPHLYDRMRAYIAERTGLPTKAIDAVLDAQLQFWQDVPDAFDAARELLEEGDKVGVRARSRTWSPIGLTTAPSAGPRAVRGVHGRGLLPRTVATAERLSASWGMIYGRMMSPDEESLIEEKPPPKGTDFVFDTAVRAVEKQLETIDRLDAKIGVVWGLQGASAIWLLGTLAKGDLSLRAAAPLYLWGLTLSPLLSAYIFAAGLLSLAAGFALAFMALLPRKYKFPVNLQEVANWRGAEATRIRFHFTDGVLKAYDENQRGIDAKGSLLRYALWFSAAGIVIITGALIGARLLAP